MKKFIKIFYILFIFLFANYFCVNSFLKLKNINTFSYNKLCKNVLNTGQIYRNFTFLYNNKKYNFKTKELLNEIILTKTQRENLSINSFNNTYNQISKFGLTKEELVNYLCPEIKIIKKKLCQMIDVCPEENYVQVIKNSCKINYHYGKEGKFLRQDDFYNKLYDCIKNNELDICFEIKTDKYSDINDIKSDFQEKAFFVTNFSSSSESRKNNIRVALAKFDGVILEQGEILSFNKTTGERNEDSGYMKAKIISNGTFVEGYGGGVCQVSTTLYNACLLAGLDILEVHNHSLPVSYVEPSFDAMVNSGSSDLIIRNNTDGKIIITTSSKNDNCKIKIFGKKNQYKIVRYSEKVKTIPAESDVVEKVSEKYGEFELNIGEEKRLSYPKDGFYSNGYLKYFDKNGILIETKKIRENIYNPTKGIILRRDN